MRLLLLPIILVFKLCAGIYDYDYKLEASKDVVSEPNLFMYGDFEKIIRYEILQFEDKEMKQSSVCKFKNIVKEIKTFKDENKDIIITIIGHSDEPTDDANELSIDSDTYANKIQNVFRYSLDSNESDKLSKNYAQSIEKMFIDENISKDILYVENTKGYDRSYTDASKEGRELSNGVMVSIYVNKIKDTDSDEDGVFDKNDLCPNTPKGIKVDVKGCMLKQTLQINFKTDSAKILQKSYPKVVKFAEFLKENPYYDVTIIGHTDSNGKALRNITLSQERAKMVKKALVDEGVNKMRLSTLGKGEIEPIQSNRTANGREANRRIEVELILKR